MRSQKQIEASRANGAKSRGPVTTLGRHNSAHPNWRKSLLSRSIVAKNECRDRFDEIHTALIQELQPATAIENLLVQKMMVAQWRQMRLWGMEKSSIAAEPSGLPERASIFESRYDRQFDRALAAIERRRGLKTKAEPATRSKQTETPPGPTRQTDHPAY